MEFLLPEKISANAIYAGIHWSKRKRIKDLYRQYMLQYKGKFTIESYPIGISYDFTFRRSPLDSSNCFLLIKIIEDSLIHINLLEDDSPKFVHSTSVTSKKGKDDRVKITIS